MDRKNVITATTTFLDITQEKRELYRAIAVKEKQLDEITDVNDKLKRDISDFEKIYDFKIKPLNIRLDELEKQIFKYQNIGEFMEDHFTFSEAEEAFDETVNDTWAHMEGEYVKSKLEPIDHKIWMTAAERDELKRLYRKLAHLFHPDLEDGDELLMMRINKAYAEGDLDSLRDIEAENCPADRKNDSLEILKRRLTYLIEQVESAKAESRSLRKSDLYSLRRKMMKSSKNKNPLKDLADKLRKYIKNKEEQLRILAAKFGISNSQVQL
jgi:hypothetical protein